MMKRFFTEWALYPFLIPLIFILNELRSVYYEYFSTGSIDKLIFILIIFFTNAAIYFIAYFVIKNKIKTGILVLIPLLFLDFYFDVFNYLIQFSFIKSLTDFVGFKIHWISVLVLGVFTLLLVVFLKRTKYHFLRLNLYLNIVFGLFLGVEIVKYTFTVIDKHDIKLENTIEGQLKFTRNTKSLPDIYVIIFDSYTANSSLKEYWNYENVEIQTFLKDRGFRIPSNSHSCYNETEFSISSILNASYLNVQNISEVKRSRFSDLVECYRNNKIICGLHKYGYKFSEHSIFNQQKIPNLLDFVFENLYYRTYFYLIQEKIFGLKNPEYKAVNEKIYNEVMSTEKQSVPKFNYIHLALPHCPYIFDSTGKEITDKSICSNCSNKETYEQQLIFSNKLMKEIVDHILKTDPNSIIDIQGDHGFRFLYQESKKDMTEEGFTIFQAIYLPDKNYTMIPDTIYAVNTFRYLFNAYFGTKMQILPNRTTNVIDLDEIREIK